MNERDVWMRSAMYVPLCMNEVCNVCASMYEWGLQRMCLYIWMMSAMYVPVNKACNKVPLEAHTWHTAFIHTPLIHVHTSLSFICMSHDLPHSCNVCAWRHTCTYMMSFTLFLMGTVALYSMCSTGLRCNYRSFRALFLMGSAALYMIRNCRWLGTVHD